MIITYSVRLAKLQIVSLLISCSLLVAHSTNIKWTGNDNQDAPLASTVPRSQKYWDEHNIERPDYAKTDAEIAAEKRSNQKKSSSLSGSIEDRSFMKYAFRLCFIGGIFVSLWVLIYRFGMNGKYNPGRGKRLGNDNSSQNLHVLNYAARMKNQSNTSESLEEKTRKARLARFQINNKKEE